MMGEGIVCEDCPGPVVPVQGTESEGGGAGEEKKSSVVRYRLLTSVREGYCKAEVWGNKDNEDITRVEAYCPICFKTWTLQLD